MTCCMHCLAGTASTGNQRNLLSPVSSSTDSMTATTRLAARLTGLGSILTCRASTLRLQSKSPCNCLSVNNMLLVFWLSCQLAGSWTQSLRGNAGPKFENLVSSTIWTLSGWSYYATTRKPTSVSANTWLASNQLRHKAHQASRCSYCYILCCLVQWWWINLWN